MSIFKAIRLFSPHQLNAIKPDASAVDQLTTILFVKSSANEELKSELPLYMALHVLQYSGSKNLSIYQLGQRKPERYS